jgi:hypothetical protein
MSQRILPIYHTGWFYLLLLFWGMSSWYVSSGHLNLVNQLNIDFLKHLSPNQKSSQNNPSLTEDDILTLKSSFNASDIGSIKTLLSYNPYSHIIFTGHQSEDFTTRLEGYLSTNPRNNKIIIAGNKNYSGQTVKIKSAMMFSSLLDWFRFSSQNNIKQINSQHFIYSPLLLNQRQSYPILWHQKDEIYFSLPAEMLMQLNKKNELALNKSWQLNLTNKENSLLPKILSLGFLGEIFISGKAYGVDQYNQSHQKNIDLTVSSASFVAQFINQNYKILPAKSSPNQFKIIIVSHKDDRTYEQIKPMLIKLTKGDFLSQNILTILLTWVLIVTGLVLIFLTRHLPLKQQLIILLGYTLVIIVLQYFKFNQQQWLEVFPIFLVVSGSWLLLLCYQKEYSLFLNALNTQPESIIVSAPYATTMTEKKSTNTSQKVYKSPQNFSPITTITTSTSPLQTEQLDQALTLKESAVNSRTVVTKNITLDNFGRYQVEGVLGKGAMGIVYQGVDPKINRHVAIKTLQLSDDVDSEEFTEAKERFFREAQTAGGLSHSNIVTIYDVGEENNLGYIAMDLLTGAPLSLFTQPGQTLPVPLIYKLLIQITDALDYAHTQNVVHRDIKPANIIYDDDLLKVTVTDFGIAYVSDNSKTRTGIIMGSPYYMSPEQILGLKVDGRSDIFSLGVTFYQLLCGQLPFEGESIATVAYQITKAKAVAVNQHNTKLPVSALRITSKAMHKDIEKRYQTMTEFKLALVNALKRDFKINAS